MIWNPGDVHIWRLKIPHRNKPVFMSIYIICRASNHCAWRCVNTPIWPHFPAPTSLLLSNKKRLFLEQPGKTLPGWFCTVCGVGACTRARLRVPPPPHLPQPAELLLYFSVSSCAPRSSDAAASPAPQRRQRGPLWVSDHTRAHALSWITNTCLPSSFLLVGTSFQKQTRGCVSPALGVKVAGRRENAQPTCVPGSRKAAVVEAFFSPPRLSRRRCSPARSWRFWLKRFDDNRRSGRVSES